MYLLSQRIPTRKVFQYSEFFEFINIFGLTFIFSAKAKRAQFVKGVNKMWPNTGNLQVASFVNYQQLLSVESVNGVPLITKDMDLQKPVISVNKNQLLIEG